MLTIHGRNNSLNVQKVVLACEEMNLPYVRHDAGGAFGIVQTPEYKAMNPNGLVPVLIDGDLVLWESNTIVRYLAAKYGAGSLWPTDPGTRALSDRWMDWCSLSFYPKYHVAFHMTFRTPEEKRDLAAVAASLAATEPMMEILDAELKGKTFLMGDQPTIGDIGLCPAVFRWMNMPIQRVARPHVEAWLARMVARPGFAKSMPLPLT